MHVMRNVKRRMIAVVIPLLAATLSALVVASPARAEPVTVLSTINYHIEVSTGNVKNGDTDATVDIEFCGTLICTGVHPLDDPNRDDRQRGAIDPYDREWADVGAIRTTYVHVSCGDAWYLVMIRVKYGSRFDTFVYDNWLPCNRWIALPVT